MPADDYFEREGDWYTDSGEFDFVKYRMNMNARGYQAEQLHKRGFCRGCGRRYEVINNYLSCGGCGINIIR